MKHKLEKIYEDEAILVINKPPFMLSIPDRFRPEIPNLYGILTKEYGKIFTIHRIDKETSGVIVFAKTEEAHKKISLQFENRLVTKKYLLITLGAMHEDKGLIEKAIVPHPHIKGKMVVAKKGKASATAWEVVERFKDYTLVEADIKTGRTHQIRVQFKAIGYPLAIDPSYGGEEAFYLSKIKGKKYKSREEEQERPLMSRVTLHSRYLRLKHPTTDEWVDFEAAPPKDFRAVVNQLQKWNKVKDFF